jgi:hypothetical protein
MTARGTEILRRFEHGEAAGLCWKEFHLFVSHPEAGRCGAVIWPVIVSCRRGDTDPWIYLRDLLRRLPAASHPGRTE